MLLPRGQWQAIEADLLQAGFTLADLGERVTWRAVWALVTHSPRDSALYREINGKDASWTLDAQLLALIADILQLSNYQRGGGKGTKPKQIQRPGVRQSQADEWGRDSVPASEFHSWWNR